MRWERSCHLHASEKGGVVHSSSPSKDKVREELPLSVHKKRRDDPLLLLRGERPPLLNTEGGKRTSSSYEEEVREVLPLCMHEKGGVTHSSS